MRGYEALHLRPESDPAISSFSPNPSYESYLKIHKVLVGPKTGRKLETLAASLGNETQPRYLVAAGWAAAEASLAQPQRSAQHRNHLLDDAESYWLQAIEGQLALNRQEKDYLLEASAPYRTALDIARLPLLRGFVLGSITPAMRQSVRDETLAIMNSVATQGRLALAENDIEAFVDLYGLMHEGNALIAFDSLDSDSLFAMPSFARSDSGHHHPGQTHDVIVVQQKYGTLHSMTPVEIKSKPSRKDRQRYKSLLIRGKMHLCMPGIYDPEHTLKAFTALNEGTQTRLEKETTDTVRQTAVNMFWQYKYGPLLTDIATSRSRLHFRDRKHMAEKYPEIAA